MFIRKMQIIRQTRILKRKERAIAAQRYVVQQFHTVIDAADRAANRAEKFFSKVNYIKQLEGFSKFDRSVLIFANQRRRNLKNERRVLHKRMKDNDKKRNWIICWQEQNCMVTSCQREQNNQQLMRRYGDSSSLSTCWRSRFPSRLIILRIVKLLWKMLNKPYRNMMQETKASLCKQINIEEVWLPFYYLFKCI